MVVALVIIAKGHQVHIPRVVEEDQNVGLNRFSGKDRVAGVVGHGLWASAVNGSNSNAATAQESNVYFFMGMYLLY